MAPPDCKKLLQDVVGGARETDLSYCYMRAWRAARTRRWPDSIVIEKSSLKECVLGKHAHDRVLPLMHDVLGNRSRKQRLRGGGQRLP